MLIGVIGENCSGKSTLTRQIVAATGGEIVTGKDYLRLAKSESEAVRLFRERLRDAVDGKTDIIYVISEPEHLGHLPDGAVRILVAADLDTIKRRFAARLHGVLPEPVARMLEKKHGMFDRVACDYRYDSATDDADLICAELVRRKAGAVQDFL